MQTIPQSFSPPQPQGFKVFVGHIPLTMKEDELSEIFDKFGNILNISIIKDKKTSVPRGCAFINYATKDEADLAINTINSANQFIGDMNKPLQVKYSDNEIEKMERKLFVGMLGTSNEDQIKALFSKYGNIEDVNIVREPDGKPKGFGFVKFSMREEAEEAIRDLDGKQTLPGSSLPIIVKFADTERQKRKKQQMVNIQQRPQMQQQQPWNNAGFYQQQQPYYMDVMQQQQQQHGNENNNPFGQRFNQRNNYHMNHGGFVDYSQQQQQQQQQQGGQESNDLFIYYLPASYGDAELKNLFQQYGNVISAKVFIDKNTGQSKCFGFVSYDRPQSAIQAINNLNGFHVEGKKLKVNFKRDRN